jgi:hypothetical protein
MINKFSFKMNTIEHLIIDRISELLDLVKIDDFQFEVEKKELIEATAIRGISGERTCLMKAEVRESNKAIYIPNIMLPFEMRYLGLGKRMIWLIFMVGDYFGYSVYLTMLTDSFKQRMLDRGALPTSEYDVLQIVKSTNLHSENDPNNDIYLRLPS